VITPLACSLVGQAHPVTLVPGTRAAACYQAATSIEDYYCNYGVNPDYRQTLEAAGLRVSGVGDDGEIRIVELPAHRFFVATLFLPQTRSAAGRPHPLLAAFATAAAGHVTTRS
jgi:CTP synthase (UTP-ammonia lyase)